MEIPMCQIKKFVVKRNVIGTVDIILAVSSGEYNNASLIFRTEIP